MADQAKLLNAMLDWHAAVVRFGAESPTAFKHFETVAALSATQAAPAVEPDPSSLHQTEGPASKPEAAGEDVWEMNYCEHLRLSLHPGVLYRFKVDPECDSCTRLAAEHDNSFCPPACELAETQRSCNADGPNEKSAGVEPSVLARNAARYQWLRDHYSTLMCHSTREKSQVSFGLPNQPYYFPATMLDEAIDKYLAAETVSIPIKPREHS